MHLIELKNASKRYVNQTFNLEINEKDFIVVTGDNGTGKTTLIHLLIGFVKPDIGMIKCKKIKIGYLPERVVLPRFINVYDYLKTLAKVKKTKLDLSLIHDFKIPIDQSIHALSKGNLQKVALTVAFLGKPDLVILDEPFSGLDDDAKTVLINYMDLKREQGMSMMISTHEPELFLPYANKLVTL